METPALNSSDGTVGRKEAQAVSVHQARTYVPLVWRSMLERPRRRGNLA